MSEESFSIQFVLKGAFNLIHAIIVLIGFLTLFIVIRILIQIAYFSTLQESYNETHLASKIASI